MKILFVLEHFHPYVGGVEFLFLQLGRELIQDGQEVTVITTRYDTQLKKEEWCDGIRIIRINARSRYSFSLKAIPAIVRALKTHDIVHTTTYNAAIPTWIATRFNRRKCILTFHEYWGQLWNKLPFLNPLQRVMYRVFEKTVSLLPFDKVVGVSDFTLNKLQSQGIPPSRLVRIYNGLDYDKYSNYRPSDNGGLHFTFVGRLGVSKGFDILLPAVDRFLSIHPDYIFQLVIPKRPDNLFKKITSAINLLKSSDRIKVYHHLPKQDLNQLIKDSSFVVIPSYSEGFCFVAAESCALGTPVLHSGMGALKEVVSGKSINFSPFDQDGLYKGLADAAANRWNNTPLKKFTLKDTIDSYMELYLAYINE